MAQEIASSSDRAPEEPSEMASPTLAAPALLGPERQNLCPSSLSPNGPHPHFSRSSRPRRQGPGLPGHPSFPTMSGACAGFTAEASSTVSIWSPRP